MEQYGIRLKANRFVMCKTLADITAYVGEPVEQLLTVE
jgi:hypothetical protein